jgi:chromosome segregation ATPase
MSDLENAERWLSRSGHDGDVIEDELAHLRARIEELKKDVAFYRDGVSEDATDPGELRERIEELEGAIMTWKAEEAAWKEVEVGLLARIEELENQNNVLHLEVNRWNQATNTICDRLVKSLGAGVASDIACQETLAARQDIGEKCFSPGIHITHKQIEQSRKLTGDLRVNLLRLGQPEIERIICNTRDELMEELGINEKRSTDDE